MEAVAAEAKSVNGSDMALEWHFEGDAAVGDVRYAWTMSAPDYERMQQQRRAYETQQPSEWQAAFAENRRKIYCRCSGDQCARGVCKCTIGNVRLTADRRVRHPRRLSLRIDNYAECSSECACRGACGVRLRTLRPPFTLVVRRCQNAAKGLGVFTREPIAAGSFICEFSGVLVSEKLWKSWSDVPFVFRFALVDSRAASHIASSAIEMCVDARECGNESRFMNHSCEPTITLLRSHNALADRQPPRLLLIARRDIRADEELTWYYGSHWLRFKREQNARFVCLCGSARCRLPNADAPLRNDPNVGVSVVPKARAKRRRR